MGVLKIQCTYNTYLVHQITCHCYTRYASTLVVDGWLCQCYMLVHSVLVCHHAVCLYKYCVDS